MVDILDPQGELLSNPMAAGPLAHFDSPAPNLPVLAGIAVSISGAHFDGGVQPFALSNALDAKLGY